MDKRWIYILIIFVIGCICLFYIAESSNTVGTANTYVGGFTITLPSSFNVQDSSGKYLQIIDRKTNERIQIKDLGPGNSIEGNITEKMDNLNGNENVTFIEKTTIKIDNETIPTIYFEKLPDTLNQACYITKYNHTFMMEFDNFHDNATMNDYAKFLKDSLIKDYKQKQD